MDSRLPELKSLPPEWEALIVAAREIEVENAREKELNAELRARVEKLGAENAMLRHKLTALEAMMDSDRHVTEARSRLDAERKRLRTIVSGLLRDYENLSKTHPLHDLLEAKEAELQRLKRSLQLVPLQHPDRKAAESMLRAHIRERDELQGILAKAQARIDETLGAVETVASEISSPRPLGRVSVDPVADHARRGQNPKIPVADTK